MRSKIKNLRTGNTVEKTFRAGEPLTAADVNKQQCQFTYTEVPVSMPPASTTPLNQPAGTHLASHTSATVRML